MSSAMQPAELVAQISPARADTQENPTPSRAPSELVPWLPCTVALDVAVTRFTVRDLLELQPGALVETLSHQSSDIPMRVNGLLMAWTEFEVIGERLAARITDLA